MAKLAVLGDFAWDMLIRTNSELLKGGDTFGEVALMPGGSAANVAVWATRCGLDTSFIGKIGRDRFGQLARENLAEEGVTAHFVETDAQLTGSVAVFVDHTGERSMVSGHGADFFLLASEIHRPALVTADHLHLTAWSFFTDPPRSAATEAARVAKEARATLSFDPSSFQMIDEMGVEAFLAVTQPLGIDIFLPNKEEGAMLTGETDPPVMARSLAELYPTALIILKLDAEGALVLLDGEDHHIPPATNNLVDATGAGDSFAGAFLAHLLAEKDDVAESGDVHSEVEAARFATSVAAWVIEHPGARPPGDERLHQALATRQGSAR